VWEILELRTGVAGDIVDFAETAVSCSCRTTLENDLSEEDETAKK